MIRKIISIDEALCNGCGICAGACHEGAIIMENGKAKLIADEYCDGLGDCLPGCPTGAITIIERESREYDEALVMQKQKEKDKAPCGCPGHAAIKLERPQSQQRHNAPCPETLSELRTWPVQLSLINTHAPYFDGADVLVAADCAAYAYGDFHRDFINDRVVMIGCPKLDDAGYYQEKLAEIFNDNDIRSVTVVRMSVPCCGGIVHAVRNAIKSTGKLLQYREVTIGTDGEIHNK